MWSTFLARFAVVCFLAFSLSLGAEQGTVVTPPDVLIKTITEDTLAAIKKERATQGGNKKTASMLVEERIAPHIDFEHMTRLAMGPSWRRATEEERVLLVREFHTLLVRTYATILDGYRDQTIAFMPVHMLPDDTDVVVHIKVRDGGREVITIDVAMEKTLGGWKTYDIAAAGASLVTTYRGSFQEEVRRSGVSGLIELLSRKNQERAK